MKAERILKVILRYRQIKLKYIKIKIHLVTNEFTFLFSFEKLTKPVE